MGREDFKKRLKDIGISQKQFAEITGYGYSTVKNWEHIPRWVSVLLNYMEAFHKITNIDESLYILGNLSEQIEMLRKQAGISMKKDAG